MKTDSNRTYVVMRNAPDETKEFKGAGEYVGQCRRVFNILEQWDGKKWRAVPHVPDRRPTLPQSHLHFGPDEPGNPYEGDEAFCLTVNRRLTVFGAGDE
jgi:hypothetical protein